MQNMNYFYNVEYFRSLRRVDEKEFQLGDGMHDFSRDRFAAHRYLEECPFESFELKTTYPGLMMGTGYVHEIKTDDAVKCGFSFDFVSGLPYLPGSSLKGILRSCFPSDDGKDKKDASKRKMIRGLLKKSDLTDDAIGMLKENIFDYGDVFFDAYPVINNESATLLEHEYITPHNKGVFKNPIPIRFIKVKPGITYRFIFDLKDFEAEGVCITAEDKKELFKEMIKLVGIGAKTNTGFGKMTESKGKK